MIWRCAIGRLSGCSFYAYTNLASVFSWGGFWIILTNEEKKLCMAYINSQLLSICFAFEANSSLWSQFDTTHSCAYIYVLPFGSSQALHIDIWNNGNGFVFHCGGIHPQDRIGLGCTFQSLQPWWNQASGVVCDEPLPCWCLCNNSHISGSENGC